LGAQGTVLAGGRYDGLIETLGGPMTPAVGWAAGIERLGMLLDLKVDNLPELIVVSQDTDLLKRANTIANLLRKGGIIANGFYKHANPNKRYKKAKDDGVMRLLSIESHDGALCAARLRDLNADDAKPVQNRIGEALLQKFELEETEIRNAHSWILKSEK